VWFVPTKPLSLDNNVLQIEVPNKFFKDWLEEHYSDMVSETLGALADTSLDVVMS